MDMEEGEYDPSAPEMNGGVLLPPLPRASPGSMTFGYGGTAGFRRQAPANRIRRRVVRNGVTETLYMSPDGLLTWVVGGAVQLSGTGDEDDDVEQVDYQDDDPYGNGRFGAVPASEAEILRLQMATTGEVREEDCAVCLDSFEEGEVLVKMTCPSSHGFHEGCIIKWLRVSRLCPLCCFALPAEHDHEEEEEEEEMDTESDETPW
ncbi:hypothetical protein ACQ4PT_002482 [Festuca glaucescens]